MAVYDVVVGNIGTVYSGTNGFEANKHYQTYCGKSKSSHGRAGGEDVTILRDGEIHREYVGSIAKQASERDQIGNTPTCEDCGQAEDHCECDAPDNDDSFDFESESEGKAD